MMYYFDTSMERDAPKVSYPMPTQDCNLMDPMANYPHDSIGKTNVTLLMDGYNACWDMIEDIPLRFYEFVFIQIV